MVSNLTNILLCFVIKCPMISFSSQFATVATIMGFSPGVAHQFVTFKTCVYITGGYLGWVKSGDMELSCWLQAILFRARGG